MDIPGLNSMPYIPLLHSTSLASRARCIAFFRSGWPISSHHRITSWFQSAPLLGEVSNVIRCRTKKRHEEIVPEIKYPAE
jgi:hypothetical protein